MRYTTSSLKLIDERTDTGYVRFFSYYSSVLALHQTTLVQMRARDSDMLAELLSEVESRILSFGDGQHDCMTTRGNSGRRVSGVVDVPRQISKEARDKREISRAKD